MGDRPLTRTTATPWGLSTGRTLSCQATGYLYVVAMLGIDALPRTIITAGLSPNLVVICVVVLGGCSARISGSQTLTLPLDLNKMARFSKGAIHCRIQCVSQLLAIVAGSTANANRDVEDVPPTFANVN